jgi:putative PIN family toxin of toxin-antitoxin system
MRVVIDTNVIISAAIRKYSPPYEAISIVITNKGILLFSNETFFELKEVMSRPKIARYISPERREDILDRYQEYGIFVEPETHIPFPEDPKDEKILAVAIEGRADFLVTGDAALLALGKVGGTRILTPKELIEELS